MKQVLRRIGLTNGSTFPALGWRSIFVLIPIAANPLSQWQYEPDKAALLIGLTGILLGWSLAHGQLSIGRGYTAECWIAAFVFVYLLSMAVSVMPHWSLWGDPAWRNGLLILVIGAVLFGLARRQFTTPERQRFALNAVLVGSSLVALYGLLQEAGYSPLIPDEDSGRVASTLAHPNLLAGYLAMTIPLNLGQIFIHWSRKKLVVAYVCVLIVQVICLIFTLSRAGWLSAMVGAATFGIICLWISDRRQLAWFLAASIVLSFMALFVLSVLPPLPSAAPHSLQTLTTMFRWKGATAQIRLIGWEASLDAIAHRPLLGYGAGTFRIVLNWFSPPDLAPFGGTGAMGGRPHNVLLRVALESGLVGLVVYIGVLIAIFVPIIKSLKSRDRHQTLVHAAIFSALIANLVNNLFSFESVVNLMLFWSLAGIAHASVLPQETIAKSITQRFPALGRVVAFSSLGIMLWLIIPDMLAYQGETGCPQRKSCDSTTVMNYAIRWSPTPEAFRSILGKIYAQNGVKDHDGQLFEKGAAIHDELVADFPEVTEYWRLRGLFYRRWYLIERHPQAAEVALMSYTQALELSPTDPDLWLDRGLTYLDISAYDAALNDFETANSLLSDYARYYGAMSIYAGVQGDIEAAVFWQQRQTEAQAEWNEWSWRR